MVTRKTTATKETGTTVTRKTAATKETERRREADVECGTSTRDARSWGKADEEAAGSSDVDARSGGLWMEDGRDPRVSGDNQIRWRRRATHAVRHVYVGDLHHPERLETRGYQKLDTSAPPHL